MVPDVPRLRDMRPLFSDRAGELLVGAVLPGTAAQTAGLLVDDHLLSVGFVTHLWPRAWFDRLVAGFIALPALAQATALVSVGLGLQQLASTDVVPFIYFQF